MNLYLGRGRPFGTIHALIAFVVMSLGLFSFEIASGTENSRDSAVQTTDDGLNEVIVTALRATAVATKMDVEVRDLPQAITFVSRETLDDLAITRIEDIGYATVGVQPMAPYRGGESIGFFTRGFDSSAVLVNGFNSGVTGGYSLAVFDLATAERVEVLRGPSSVLFGQGNPGGIINITTKTPKDEFGLSADIDTSTDRERRATLDVTGPAGPIIAYRLNLVGEDSGSFREFVSDKRFLFAPSLTIKPTENLNVVLDYIHDRFSFTPDRYAGIVPELIQAYSDGQIPLSRNLGEPWLPNTVVVSQTIRTLLEYTFAPQWTFRVGFFDTMEDFPSRQAELYPDSVVPGTTQLIRDYSDSGPDNNVAKDRDHTLNAQITGRFSTGPIDHAVIVSYDDTDAHYGYISYYGTVDNINYLNPAYSAGPLQPTVNFNYEGGFDSKYQSFYVQDLLSLGDHWKLLAGLRHDAIDSTYYNDVELRDPEETQKDHKVTPRLGLIFRPVDPTTLYVSWSESFLPNIGENRFGQVFNPQKGSGYELGIKQEFLNRNLALTADIYQIKKSDILVTDPGDPTGESEITAGDARSRGFEGEMVGRLTPQWEVRSGVAYTDAKMVASVDPVYFPVGDRLPGSAEWTLNAGSSYKQLSGLLAGSKIGFNAAYSSDREYNLPNPAQELPAYFKLDLFGSHNFGNVNVQLNIENITNSKIFLTNTGGVVSFDRPRRALLSIKYNFGSLK